MYNNEVLILLNARILIYSSIANITNYNLHKSFSSFAWYRYVFQSIITSLYYNGLIS